MIVPERIKLFYGTVIRGGVWMAGSTLRVGVDVDEDEAASLLKDGLAEVETSERTQSFDYGEEHASAQDDA